jgi:superfamily II DNA or RNA helicase
VVVPVSALRQYQQEAHDSLYAGWRAGTRRLGVSLPTGTGKTHVMAHLARTEVARADQGGAVLYLVHRDTLVEQTVAKLRVTLPATTSIGVVKGPRNEVAAQVIVASVHSLRRADRRATLPRIRLGVADEAHVSVSPTYRALYDHVGPVRWAGFSATWTRSDGTGLGDCWDEVVYARSIRWAVRHGYLVPAVGEQVGDGVDVGAARVSRATGDYREDDLEALVMLEELRDVVTRTALTRDPDRPTVLFAPTVASADYFGAALSTAGLRVGGFYGHTPPSERRRLDAGLRDGSVQVVTTCTAIAEGYDNPQLSRCLLVRPTRHEGLFVQMVGRFLRPWPGKSDALVLDFVGATDDVALRNAVDLSTTRPDLHVDADPADELDLLDEEEPPEQQGRMVKRVHATRAVELYAGTPVQWNLGPAGTPFVGCGDSMVFMLEGPTGWYVGHAQTRITNGRPLGRWVAEGLSQDDALTVASDYAEEQGGTLARRSSGWRRQQPSDAQVAFAHRVGIDTTGMTRGALSDAVDQVTTSRVLGYFAAWAARQKVGA